MIFPAFYYLHVISPPFFLADILEFSDFMYTSQDFGRIYIKVFYNISYYMNIVRWLFLARRLNTLHPTSPSEWEGFCLSALWISFYFPFIKPSFVALRSKPQDH